MIKLYFNEEHNIISSQYMRSTQQKQILNMCLQPFFESLTKITSNSL